MSFDLTSWSDAFRVVRSAALHARGALVYPSPIDREVWPRTLGVDAIAIAAVLDPYVRSLSNAAGATLARWESTTADLAAHALFALHRPYRKTRSFWRTLSAVCVHLDEEHAPLPALEIWDALVGALAEPFPPRNARTPEPGPFGAFPAKTYDELYVAQLNHLRVQRGFDKVAPEPGGAGGERIIPRSTNADVLQLADYWSRQLDRVKQVMGHAGVATTWKAALVDVDQHARKGAPAAVYAKNNVFWRALQRTAIHVAAADEAPTESDQMIDAIRESVANLPENLATGAKSAINALGEAAEGVAKGAATVVDKATKGLMSGLGTPVLVGAGLLGAYLLLRRPSSDEARAV